MYAGLSILFFFLVLFLQQICGYTPLQSGLATLPVDADHVRAVAPLRRAGGSLRAPPVHGRRPAGGGGWPAAVSDGWSAGGIRHRSAAAAAGVRARAVDDRGTADCGGTRRDRSARRGSPRGSTTRSRVWRGCSARRRSARRSRRAFAASLDSRLAGVPLGAEARAAVNAAKRLPLGRPNVSGRAAGAGARGEQGRRTGVAAQLPPRTWRSRQRWWRSAAWWAWRGIRNPRAEVTRGDCAAGQLVGINAERWRGHARLRRRIAPPAAACP